MEDSLSKLADADANGCQSVSTVSDATTKKKSPEPAKCDGCDETFPSRNAVFKHLKETGGACLSKDAYHNFIRYVRKTTKPKKCILLFGYLPCPPRICNGQDAGMILLQAIHRLQNEMDGIDDDEENDDVPTTGTSDENDPGSGKSSRSLNRSYGNSSRASVCLTQDENTGAITEVLAVRLHPLCGSITLDEWLDRVQGSLDKAFDKQEECMEGFEYTPIRILGRQDMPNAKFNAEMDVSHRRIEYLLPIDFLTWSIRDTQLKGKIESSLSTFTENNKHNISHVSEADPDPPEDTIRGFLLALKRKMKLLTTQVITLDTSHKSSVMEKGFSLKKRKQGKVRQQQKKTKKGDLTNKHGVDEGKDDPGDANAIDEVGFIADEDPATSSKSFKADEKQRLLKRKRFHNFTENLMAHEYLACRRLDRIYHRATLRFSTQGENLSEMDDCSKVKDPYSTTYIIVSMSGDMFLTGQVFRIIGIFLALANGVIEPGFVECVFDENYPHLVPTPAAPFVGMVAGDAHYMTQEGKTQSILSPRVANRYRKGWNQASTLYRVKDWQEVVYGHIVRKWKTDCRDPTTGRLQLEKEWTEGILLPWAKKANSQLEDYQRWLKTRHEECHSLPIRDINGLSCMNPPVSEASLAATTMSLVDSSVPEAYAKVLTYLRQLDSSGLWPMTTPKRQLVMISTAEGEEAKEIQADSLSMALVNAKNNRRGLLSAYSYAEGQGGASGSFSVGLMPGGVNKEPKANSMFPELVKAAFELELKLCPEREPSSTIAINRNAQFRPHIDSGAGAGQSTSLIVGLGTYSGGELMVEGEKHDIRYNAIEFNGWKQRHWTLPFNGERYSLVWFTPKGCEGLRGIDLELDRGPTKNKEAINLDDWSTE